MSDKDTSQQAKQYWVHWTLRNSHGTCYKAGPFQARGNAEEFVVRLAAPDLTWANIKEDEAP